MQHNNMVAMQMSDGVGKKRDHKHDNLRNFQVMSGILNIIYTEVISSSEK